MEEFIEQYCVTRNHLGEWVPVTDSVKNLIRSYEENRFNMVLKARQVGLTTSMRLYSMYKMMEQPGTTVLYLCNARHQGENFIREITNYLLTKELPYNEMLSNRVEVTMDNRSKVLIGSTVERMRGVSPDIILMDEFAFLPSEKQEQYLATCPVALRPNGRIIIGSSSNGDELFFRLWRENNAYEKHNLPFHTRPEFNNPGWYRNQVRTLNYNQPLIESELNANFWTRDGVFPPILKKPLEPVKYLKRHKL